MKWMALSVTAALCFGCGADSETNQAADASMGADTVTERFWVESPESDEYFTEGGYLLPTTHATVVHQFSIDGEVEPGIAIGFDLDETVSPEGDESSCGHGDKSHDDFGPGIDNQFANVWDLIEPLVGPAIRALLQEAINEGRFLLIMELEGLDDPKNDDSVTLRVLRGQLEPAVGASGFLLPDQTFTIDREFPISVVENVAIVDGIIEAGPIEVAIPIEIFDANFTLRIRNGRLKFSIDEDGGFTGVLGGGIHVGDAIGELLETGAAAEAGLVQPVFESNADLGKSGDTCELISAAFGFATTPGYVVRYASDADLP
ncbi:MAG: hypothetical protein ACI9OJ_001194 [Myxococcota bacterium]|jgi:hypothetical protein